MARALRDAQPVTDRFLVYAANLRVNENTLTPEYIHPDWGALAVSGRPLVAVIRAGDRLARWLDDDARLLQAVAALQQTAARIRERATAAGAPVPDFQLDYDCPTAQLGGYTKLLLALSKASPALHLSITALPTWLSSRRFAPLARAAASFTLQVHGVERPTTIDNPIVLCDYRKIPAWVAKASAVGVPFTVALPTYGYRVLFDRAGKFRGLLAEDRASSPPSPDFQERLVIADPAALAPIVADLRRQPPPHCRALTWFRLPIETDRLNWPWAELRSVMAGRPPRIAFRAEVRPAQDDPAVAELWLANAGEANVWGEVQVPVHRNKKKILASDNLMGFREEAGDLLVGPPPPVGAAIPIAWYRLAADVPTSTTLIPGEVRALP